MTVRGDAQNLQPQALMEFYIFDPTNIGQSAASKLYWHPGTQNDVDPIVWQGVTYNPFPVEATGFEQTAVGKLPRPKIRASNISGALGAFLRTMQDGIGARVIRKRTYGKYLDAVNFPGGNPYANSSAQFADEVFYLARKVSENPIFVEFEMAVAFDVAGIVLPRRQVIAGTCQWIYRSPECSYAGAKVTTDPVYPGLDVNGDDRCGKTLAACKLRFGQNGVLPTSAFPASILARYV